MRRDDHDGHTERSAFIIKIEDGRFGLVKPSTSVASSTGVRESGSSFFGIATPADVTGTMARRSGP